MAVFEEIDEHQFLLQWVSNLVPINDFNRELLRERKRELIEFLDPFYIMSEIEVVEYVRSDDNDKKSNII